MRAIQMTLDDDLVITEYMHICALQVKNVFGTQLTLDFGHIKNIDIVYTDSYTLFITGGMPMPNIKTAISIEKPIFDQVNDLAKYLNISRSRLFAIAAQEFIQRHKNMELLQAINEAYEDLPDPETKIVEKMRPRHLKMVKNQW